MRPTEHLNRRLCARQPTRDTHYDVTESASPSTKPGQAQPEAFTSDPDRLARFEREAEVASRPTRHF